MHSLEGQGNRLKIDNNNNKNKLDADLIALICQGDEAAFEQLYHRMYHRLFRFIARITRRTDMIDEIINETMFVVWEKAGTYSGQSLVTTWVLGIAYNKSRQSLRDHRRGLEDSLEEMDGILFFESDNLSNRLETVNWLEAAFDSLSPEQLAVIELTYYHGLHYSEIAELLGCPENTVKTRMHHARKKLAKQLKEY